MPIHMSIPIYISYIGRRMIKISIKLTYEEVKECVENKGYELISTKYISNSK